MASGVLPFHMVIGRSGPADDRKPDRTKRTSSPKWWSPIFGFSSDPDYLNSDDKRRGSAAKVEAEAEGESRPERSRFAPGAFTAEKARRLRRMNYDASSFHESMYHSAIATRLASDFSDRTADA